MPHDSEESHVSPHTFPVEGLSCSQSLPGRHRLRTSKRQPPHVRCVVTSAAARGRGDKGHFIRPKYGRHQNNAAEAALVLAPFLLRLEALKTPHCWRTDPADPSGTSAVSNFPHLGFGGTFRLVGSNYIHTKLQARGSQTDEFQPLHTPFGFIPSGTGAALLTCRSNAD